MQRVRSFDDDRQAHADSSIAIIELAGNASNCWPVLEVLLTFPTASTVRST